ncbi:hypothetical protein VM1G_11137 [Cytospora mali]|uniref:Uncharacterized protein n=1 Tax=Cytospora mali TaxID=578113 RepID=A0A194VJL0_CYTMA|nr:hypothetical protein VM1G_11137 [Valsa mali]
MAELSLENSYLWNYCAPDGSFSFEPQSPWKLAWAFQIVLGFGSLTFTQAKVIDVVWDIGVGRIGQTILAYFSWKAFSVHVRMSMERAPITYRVFWTSFMQNEATFRSTVRMIRDFTMRRSLRSKAAMVFMIASMIFVIVFPTLASAMTGYTASNEAVIKLEDGNQAPFNKFKQFYYIIHDGNRVNFSAEYLVFSRYDACGYGSCVDYYIHEYGILQDTNSTWERYPDNIQLPSPTLNITPYDGKANNKSFIYTPDNTTYTLPNITSNAVCQPVIIDLQQRYQWGFSVIQLELTLILLTIWSFGVWIMWLDAHLKLTSRGKYEVPHEFKATLYLTDSIRDDFIGVGEEPESLTNDEIRRQAREHLKGGRVEIQAPQSENDYSLRRWFWQWVKGNKLWTFSFLFAIGTSFNFRGNSILLLMMSFAMAAGWGKKTRAAMAWAAFIAGSIVNLTMFYISYREIHGLD